MFPLAFNPTNPAGPNDQPGTRPAPDSSLASRRFQQQLVERYQRGHLSLAQVHAQLAAATFQLLYRSQATTLPTPEQLREIVQRARQANAAAQITGLLLYCEGQFMQVLEGPQEIVEHLFARISQDPRHRQVAVVSKGLLPSRQFAEWSMDFGFADAGELEAVLVAIGQEHRQAETTVSSRQLQALLSSFVGTSLAARGKA